MQTQPDHPDHQRHSENGHNALYVNSASSTSIVGVTQNESRATLEFQLRHLEQNNSKLNEATAGIFFERVVRPKAIYLETNTKHVDKLRSRTLSKALDYLT